MSDVSEETLTSEAAMETDITEQQQAALQQEERVLTEQIESLQKEKWVSIAFYPFFIFPCLLSISDVSSIVSGDIGNVEMTKTCCLYSGNSVKVVTSGKEAPWAVRPEVATVMILDRLTGTLCVSLSQDSSQVRDQPWWPDLF